MAPGEGLVTGCIIGGVLAFIFMSACLYSIVKAFRRKIRDRSGRIMAYGEGLVSGCMIGGILAFIFMLACLYSIIKAFRDRRRIIEKNKHIRQQKLLAVDQELGGGGVSLPPPPIIPEILEPEPNGAEADPIPRRARLGSAPNIRAGRRPSAFAPPPEPEERRWEKEGLEYRAQGKTAHIHRTQSSDLKSKDPTLFGDGQSADRLRISEPGARQRSASADIPRPLLPSGEPDYSVGLLPTKDFNKENSPAHAPPKQTLACTDDTSPGMIKVTVTTHEVKDVKGWV